MTDRWVYVSIMFLVFAVLCAFLGSVSGMVCSLLFMCFCMVRAALSVGREND